MTPSRVSPAILFVIVVLAAAFFLCGSFHLLYRILRAVSLVSESHDPEVPPLNPFQRQLQQLFRLHDSGLDQAVIDSLPVFLFGEITKSSSPPWKEQFDCAVCLCEFSHQDKLRLLPLCSHAFHVECIDSWLLSNSTCPLCRGSLLCSPGFGFDDPVFEFGDHGAEEGDGCSGVGDNGIVVSSKRAFSVRLGRLQGVLEGNDGHRIPTGETSSSSIDARRCYSMGSYRYIVSDTVLRVASCGNDGEPRSGISNGEEAEGMRINLGSRGESFSVSKIWQWSSKTRRNY
ncbi:hypothetical protein MLD38_024299 [Melastoma candidum]|uniref:Uncharacterized protein n=1 Tax=Melastoma candidum TaxID=119954 RepID=A0ACB9NWW2_9MYRT|nr:hypothetical protein MLD38_024299 [Melastoma candidum]